MSRRLPEATAQARQIRRSGYTRLAKPYAADLIEPVRMKYLKYIEDERFSQPRAHSYLLERGLWFSRSIVDPGRQIPEIAGLLTPEVRELVAACYGSHFDIVGANLWRNYHASDEVRQWKNQVYSNNWHCDDQRSDQLTLFINLSQVTEDDGPLHLLSRQRTRNLMRRGYRSRGNYGLPETVLEDARHVIRHVGPVGSAVLCNTTLCLHRAGVPAENHVRDIMELRFQISDKPLEIGWLSRMPPNNDD